MYDKALTVEPRYDASFRLNASFRLSASQREALAAKLAWKLRTTYEHTGPPGIHVLSVSEVAEILDKSMRQLFRLELRDKVPRRRRISLWRTGYFVHELEDLCASCVVVRDARMLDREQLAGKLGMNGRTVSRMVRQGRMPPPTRGRWLERDIDAWLLECPRV